MPELLHDVNALHELAKSAPEPARSWAAALCCVWEPGRGVAPTIRHPVTLDGWLPAMLADPDLPLDPAGPGTASLITDAPRYGIRFDSTLVPALRSAFEGAAPADRPALALALAQLGALEGAQLQAAAQEAAPEEVAALVVWLATASGQGAETAAQAIPPLSEPQRFYCLDLLGTPRGQPISRDPEAIVAQVAEAVGAPAPSPPKTRGSAWRRAAAWVDRLLGDRDDALSHALRASLSPGRSSADIAETVFGAAWLGLYRPSDDPVHDVLHRGGAHHAETLARARERGGLPIEAPALFDGDLHLAEVSPASLAAASARLPIMAPAFIRADPQAAERALQTRRTDLPGLMLASWCPTLGVLQGLLDHDVPYDPDARRAYGWALACMGDPVAAAHLRALADQDHELDLATPLALTEALGLSH